MSVPLEEEASADAAVFNDADVLTNAEVKFLFDSYLEGKKNSTPNFVPPVTLKKTKDYVERFSTINNQVAAVEIRKQLETHNLKKYELAALVNLAPETVEEAVTLIPSLKDGRFEEADVENILNEMIMYRTWE